MCLSTTNFYSHAEIFRKARKKTPKTAKFLDITPGSVYHFGGYKTSVFQRYAACSPCGKRHLNTQRCLRASPTGRAWIKGIRWNSGACAPLPYVREAAVRDESRSLGHRPRRLNGRRGPGPDRTSRKTCNAEHNLKAEKGRGRDAALFISHDRRRPL